MIRNNISCEANTAFTNCKRASRDRSVSFIAVKERKTVSKEVKVHDSCPAPEIMLESENAPMKNAETQLWYFDVTIAR